MSFLKTTLLLSILTAILVGIGGAVGGEQGAALFFVIALVMNFFSYWFSDSLVLAYHGAREVAPEDAPELHAIVERLAERAAIKKPRVCVIEDASPNAFATGRGPSKSAVCVTTGLLRLLNRRELEGVLAHELGHVANRDVLISTIAAALAGGISMAAHALQWGLLFGGGRRDDRDSGIGAGGALVAMIVAPVAALLVQLAISRTREYAADQTGARLAGDPEGLASALEKISDRAHPLASATGGTAHLFISDPFGGARGLVTLFQTHPPIEERVRRLRALAPDAIT